MTCPYGNIIHVVGIAGTEGAALLEYLTARYPSVEFHAHNSGPKKTFLKHYRLSHVALPKEEALERGKALLQIEGVEYHFEDDYLKGIESADTIFVPQSWYLYADNAPLKAHEEKFRSITRLYFDLFPGKIIGVTGSNGKTTTTNLIAEIMKRFYPSTLFSGNDRRAQQVLEQIEEADENDWLVLEISNRQLMIDLGKSPDIGVITNITPNHLNEYRNFEEYAAVKASLLKDQSEQQWSVLNWDDEQSKKLIEVDGGETMPFSTEEMLPKGVFVHFGSIVVKHADEEEIVMPVADFPLKGKHNLANALAAVAACYLADVDLEEIAQTLRSIEAIPQRMEFIQKVNEVEYYNDSASTAPESTLAAMDALEQSDQKLIMILGGSSKGMSYEGLTDRLRNLEVILLRSPVADDLSENLGEACVVETLQEAVELASQKAEAGDRVLFSPAAEYFTYFKDKMPGYKQFRHIVSQL